ncbi:MAG: PAS domain S-box protein, partial [Gemmatimonadales bacterium]
MRPFLSVWLRPQRHQIPLKIAGIYAVVGALWIVFSDRALAVLVPPTATGELTRFQTVKGLYFVGLTALLVYWLVKSALEALARTEAALQESESRYRQIFQATGSMAWLVAADSRIILDANPAAAAFYGWSREELIGKNLAELEVLPPDRVAAEYAAAAAAGRKYVNLAHRLRSGKTRDVEVYPSALLLDGRQCLFAIIHDVTERRVVERSLAESEARYRQLLTEASDGILLSDPQGRILEVNPCLCDMLGWSREALLGRNIEDLLPPAVLSRRPFRSQELEGGRTLVNERRLLSRSGSVLDTEICSRVVEGGSLLSLVRDVTRRRQIEEQLRQAQRMEAVGRLTGGIAHDLNNLLTVVLVNGELIAEALPPGRADLEGDLEDLRAAAQRGATMIAKLLSFSRRAPLSFVTLDLAEVVG